MDPVAHSPSPQQAGLTVTRKRKKAGGGEGSTFCFPCEHSSSRSLGTTKRWKESSPKTTTTSNNDRNIDSTSFGPSQEFEYDEGLDVYSTNDESVEESSLAVLYRTAQQHTRQGEYATASRWLELALIRGQVQQKQQKNTTDSDNQKKHTSMLIRLQHTLGYALYRLGRNSDALRAFLAALSLAVTHCLGDIEEAHARNAVGVLLLPHAEQHEQACREQFQRSLQLYSQHSKNSKEYQQQIGTVWNNLGRLYFLQRDYPQALVAYQEALMIRRAYCHVVKAVDVAVTICNTGQTHQQLGHMDEAEALFQEFMSSVHEHLGPRHRDVGIIQKCLADIVAERGDVEKAGEMYEEALDIVSTAAGAMHPELSAILNRLGNLHFRRNQLPSALKYYRRGLLIEQSILEPSHPHLLVTLMNIAQIYRKQGHFEAALDYYRDINQRTVTKFGMDSIEAAKSMSDVALMQYQLRNYDLAIDLYLSVLTTQTAILKSREHEEVASTLNSLGLVFFNQGRHEVAEGYFQEALQARIKLFGTDHREVAVIWYNLATIHLERGNEDLAARYYRETFRIERKVLGADHPDVILTSEHLGIVYQQKGELEEALHYFQEALHMERRNDRTENQAAVAKLLNLIGNIHMQMADIDAMMECYTESTRIHRSLQSESEALVIVGTDLYGLTRVYPANAAAA